ncbi:MAG: hypothetical protein M0004_08715 [Actinomycetota bacterium]|nr:hypothetical protein [Actinomycetota bacterium]
MHEHSPGSWLFPSTSGRARQGERDPFDADDRSWLIAAEHPGLLEELGNEDRVRAHLALHEVVADQLLSGEPPEVWATAQRLSAAGHDRHDICHMLATCWATVFHDAATRNETATDPAVQIDLAAYRSELEGLPGTWLALEDDEEEQDDASTDLFDAALRELEAIVALTRAELALRLGVEEARLEPLEGDPEVVSLDQDRLASVTALLSGVTLTRVLSGEEVAADAVVLDGGLAPVAAWLAASDAELAAGLSLERWELPRLVGIATASPRLGAGMRLGIRLGPDVLSVLAEPQETLSKDRLASVMRDCLERFALPEGMRSESSNSSVPCSSRCPRRVPACSRPSSSSASWRASSCATTTSGWRGSTGRTSAKPVSWWAWRRCAISRAGTLIAS